MSVFHYIKNGVEVIEHLAHDTYEKALSYAFKTGAHFFMFDTKKEEEKIPEEVFQEATAEPVENLEIVTQTEAEPVVEPVAETVAEPETPIVEDQVDTQPRKKSYKNN
jgi:hypothetical protein